MSRTSQMKKERTGRKVENEKERRAEQRRAEQSRGEWTHNGHHGAGLVELIGSVADAEGDVAAPSEHGDEEQDEQSGEGRVPGTLVRELQPLLVHPLHRMRRIRQQVQQTQRLQEREKRQQNDGNEAERLETDRSRERGRTAHARVSASATRVRSQSLTRIDCTE